MFQDWTHLIDQKIEDPELSSRFLKLPWLYQSIKSTEFHHGNSWLDVSIKRWVFYECMAQKKSSEFVLNGKSAENQNTKKG